MRQGRPRRRRLHRRPAGQAVPREASRPSSRAIDVAGSSISHRPRRDKVSLPLPPPGGTAWALQCLEPIPSPPLLDSVRGDRGEIDLTLAPCAGSPADPVQLEPAQPPLHRIPPQPTDRPPSLLSRTPAGSPADCPAASGTPLLPESRCHCPRTGSSVWAAVPARATSSRSNIAEPGTSATLRSEQTAT